MFEQAKTGRYGSHWEAGAVLAMLLVSALGLAGVAALHVEGAPLARRPHRSGWRSLPAGPGQHQCDGRSAIARASATDQTFAIASEQSCGSLNVHPPTVGQFARNGKIVRQTAVQAWDGG